MKQKYNRFLPLAAAVVALSPMATTLGAEKPNMDTSHAQSVTNLGALTIGGLPTDIQTVINNINAYKAVEDGKLLTFVAAEDTAATAVTAKQTEINDKADEIDALIAADPLDPQIAVEQANLATLQGELPALQTALVNAANGAHNANSQLGCAHLHGEHRHRQTFFQGHVFGDVDGQGGLAHGWPCRQHNQITGLHARSHAV
jgi:hypothetical protein